MPMTPTVSRQAAILWQYEPIKSLAPHRKTRLSEQLSRVGSFADLLPVERRWVREAHAAAVEAGVPVDMLPDESDIP